MQISVALPSEWGPIENLREEVEFSLSQNDAGASVRFTAREGRAIETAVLVALIGGGATVIAAIIQAVAAIASKRKAKTIKITGSKGGHIEVPIDASPEQIETISRSVALMQDPELHVD
jgi:hypothetical protein